jgi:hypothetical protein
VIGFIVYDTNGDILRTGTCVDSDLALQAGDGEFVIEGEADDELHTIVDGKIVDKPPPPAPTDTDLNEQCLAEIRARRDKLLARSDFTQLPDSPLSDEQKAAYQTYRQQLRDLPETYADATSIDQVTFPTKP